MTFSGRTRMLRAAGVLAIAAAAFVPSLNPTLISQLSGSTLPACASNLTPNSGIPFCLGGQVAPSPMNQLLPARPKLDPKTVGIAANLNSGQHSVDLSEFGTTVFDSAQGTTTVTLRCTAYGGGCTLKGKRLSVNPSWRPSWGSDRAMVVIDYASRTVYDFWQVAVTSQGTINVAGGKLATAWGGVSSLDGNGQSQATGSNLSHMFGMVRMFEMVNAPASPSTAIPHALNFSSSFTCSTFRYPATKSDGSSTGNCIPEGARVYLDSTANCGGVSPSGAEAVCYALQKFGAYNVDTGGAPVAFGFEGDGIHDVPSAYRNAGFSADYYNLTSIPWSHLHVAVDCQCQHT